MWADKSDMILLATVAMLGGFLGLVSGIIVFAPDVRDVLAVVHLA